MAVKRVTETRNPPNQTKKRKFVTNADDGDDDSRILDSSHGLTWKRVEFVGKGGFGYVYVAVLNLMSQVNGSPTQMAVKSALITKSFTLQYEKLVLGKLNESPYVVHCYGDEVTKTHNGQNVYNLFLEYCSGLSLNHHIKRLKGLPEFLVRELTRDVVKGLKYIHESGYAHCDIKPHNILLAPNRKARCRFMAKIGDLGLAKEMKKEVDDVREIRGTYRYMSPELIKEKKVDYPGDIWSLGCSIMEMLSGKAAWNYSDVDKLKQVIGYSKEVPELPSGLQDVVSPDCKDFLSKCLVRNVAERWSADKLLRHPFLAKS